MEINVTLTIALAEHVQQIANKLLAITPRQQVVESVKASPLNNKIAEEVKDVEAAAPTTLQNEDPSPKQEIKPVELSTLQSKVSELIQLGKRQQIKDVLASYGVSGFSQLNNDERTEFYNKILTL